MKTWTSKELTDLAAADQMELATARPDGSLRRPVTIWVVRYGGDLYVRCHEGHIRAGGVDRDVGFVEVGDSVRHPIDAAYRTKYRRYGSRYVDPMVSPKARAATIKLLPR